MWREFIYRHWQSVGGERNRKARVHPEGVCAGFLFLSIAWRTENLSAAIDEYYPKIERTVESC
jgi:hypothetical protein